MTNEFTPYDLALKMKSLGFDEPCIAIYSNANPKTGLYTLKKYRLKLIKQASQKDKGVKAPTWQSAFRWFREKYNIYAVPMPFSGKNAFYIQVSGKGALKFDYDTYEEAELECLVKLIEIVESNT